jgi:hypothetical protein
MAECSIENCTRPTLAKGLCASHYQSQRLQRVRAEARSVERECAHCGVCFSGKRLTADYCSMSCKQKARYKRRPKVKVERAATFCRECGVEIKRAANARYCSRKCMRRASVKRRRTTRVEEMQRICSVCGAAMPIELFVGARYCSAVCRRVSGRARKYGITGPSLYALTEAHGGRCALCGTEQPGGKGDWHVDHCHDSGEVRGLLCHRCNVGLGNFRDDARLLRAAANYVEREVTVDG